MTSAAPADSLYLCYQSIRDPLTQTQVVAYLEGLARAGYRLLLLTFEARPLTPAESGRWQTQLAAKGVRWHWLRYHRRPTVPATAWDIMGGALAAARLVRRAQVRLIHARGHVPGAMALLVKRLTGARLLLDLRGLLAEERVDSGAWRPGGLLFRIAKRIERAFVRAADAVVVLTEKARDLLASWYATELAGKPLVVIPCCVDFRVFPRVTDEENARRWQQADRTLVYVGTLGGLYPVADMVTFFVAARQALPRLRWQVWSHSDPGALRQQLARRGLNGDVVIGRVAPEALSGALSRAHAGLCLYQRTRSGPACSPTKVGEYLAAGLPVIATAGIGDVDSLLATDGAVGTLVRGDSEKGYRDALEQLRVLLADPDISRRCRAVAERNLDLEQVGWRRYCDLYRRLLSTES
jgi:glycosyltransferase involved in cell wall biosynthesis